MIEDGFFSLAKSVYYGCDKTLPFVSEIFQRDLHFSCGFSTSAIWFPTIAKP